MSRTSDQIKRSLEKDPSGEDVVDLIVFLLQDPQGQKEIKQALEELRPEFGSQVDRIQNEIVPEIQDLIDQGVISDNPGMPGTGPNQENTARNKDEATEALAMGAGLLLGGGGTVKAGAKIGSLAIKAFTKNRATKIAGGGLLSLFGMNALGLNDADPGTGGDHNAASLDPNTPPDDGILAAYRSDGSDGNQPGQWVTITADDLDPEFQVPGDPGALGQEPGLSGLSGNDPLSILQQGIANLGAQANITGLNPQVLGTTQINDPISLPSINRFPERPRPELGEVEADSNRPGFGVGQAVGGAVNQPAQGQGSNLFGQTFGLSPDAALSRLPPSQMTQLNQNTINAIDIPAGAELAPRVFTQVNGKPLIDIAREASFKYGVPLNILYGMVDLESGWDPNAVGDNGTSFGLVQIHRPAFPNITRSQAMDPKFALEFAARQLRDRFNKYNSWEAAVAAHNSPVAADYLAKTGNFYNQKSSDYTTAIMNKANASGLSSTTFDFGAPGGQLPGIAGIGASLGGANAVFPVEGGVLPGASEIGNPRDGGVRQHQGLDIMGEEGAAVLSTVSGTVRYASNRGGKGGYAVSIQDEQGNWHYFAHLSPQSAALWQQQGITQGAVVQAGSLIGYVGSTGNASGGASHLHYSINEGRKDMPLIDPWDYLQGSNMAPTPEFNPFQARDPSTSRDFIQGLYHDILGREATPQELEAGIGRLGALDRTGYDRDIQAARGLSVGAFSPDDRFTEGLLESGEADFAKERSGVRSFTDYASNIASLLQRGL